jgi:hypothetical protein
MTSACTNTFVTLTLAAAVALASTACSAAANDPTGDSRGYGPNGGSSGGGNAPASGGATPSGSGGTGGKLDLDASPGDAPDITPDSACAADTFQAEPAPLNLMVMLDRSCSMSEPAGDPLWDRTKAGLTQFFSDPAADGIGVALHYFPTPDTTDFSYCSGDEATPTVPLAKLGAESAPADAQEQKLVDSMDAQSFNFGGTPMYQALYGALAYASVFAQDHGDEQMVVVLVTDGVPGESCDFNTNNNITHIAALAAWAHDNSPFVSTFAIGLAGSSEAEIASIAQAGGGDAFFLGSSPNLTDDLFQKLDSIKQSNLGCTFKLPKGSNSKPADPSKVNVVLSNGGGETKYVKVDGPGACVAEGWYYDDDQHPSKIELCPEACSTVKAAPTGNVQVLLGCATEIPK